MTQPLMPDLPGFDTMADTLEFVKKMWGGKAPAGLSIPARSEEELNKQIADLKAVEAWLEVNANMLRNTIQVLEMQSAALSALRTMGEVPAAATETSMHADAAESAAAWWNVLQEQFNQTVARVLEEEQGAPKKKATAAASAKTKKAAAKTTTKTATKKTAKTTVKSARRKPVSRP